jgi:hypothetical protein
MGRKGHSPEQIVRKLREAEAAQATGCTVVEACRQIGISEQTYYGLLLPRLLWKSHSRSRSQV